MATRRAERLVCFGCRRVLRREPEPGGSSRCASCGGALRAIPERIPVPPRGNERAWAALRESLDEDPPPADPC
jgi:hypothetical protein